MRAAIVLVDSRLLDLYLPSTLLQTKEIMRAALGLSSGVAEAIRPPRIIAAPNSQIALFTKSTKPWKELFSQFLLKLLPVLCGTGNIKQKRSLFPDRKRRNPRK